LVRNSTAPDCSLYGCCVTVAGVFLRIQAFNLSNEVADDLTYYEQRAPFGELSKWGRERGLINERVLLCWLSLAYQKNERTSERRFFQFPLAHEDGIEHQTSFSLTPDQIG
jgi:hypothetical protein